MSKGILGRLDSLVNELGEGRACWGHDFIDAAVDAMERIDELEGKLKSALTGLNKIADTDPDDGTAWFHDVANETLTKINWVKQ